MSDREQPPSGSEARRRAELVYAQYLDRRDDPQAESFEQLVERHPEDEKALRAIHSGMARVQGALDPSASSLHLGYELLEELGSGGHGTVYRARDRALDCDVAIKTFEDDGSRDQHQRFLVEARAMAKIRHPNVVRVHAVDEVEQSIRLILEYIEGHTLEDLVGEQGPLSAQEAAQVGVDLCAALGALHNTDLVHMDLKPGNVMRERGGRTVLLDFSLARSPSLSDARLGGTPPFMAPEHFGQGSPGPWTDVYGLGATLYWLVCGRYPLDSDSIGELREGILAGRVTPLLDVEPTTPREFAEIVEKAMSPAPEDRYPSAGHFGRALRDFLAGSSSAAPRPPSRRGLWIGATLAAAGLIAALLFGPWRGGSTGLGVRARLLIHPGGTDEGIEVSKSSRVRIADDISVTVQCDEPFYAYLFNEDEVGLSYTLYPRSDPEPIAPGDPVSLGRWTVDSAGGVEHLFLVTSRHPSLFGEELRKRVNLAKAGFTPLALDDQGRRRLHSVSRGLGVQVEEDTAPPASEANESLKTYFASFETIAKTRSDEDVQHWALPHADD